MTKKPWVGALATIASIVSFFPLLWHTTTKQTTESISFYWIVSGLISQSLWMYYGITNQLWPVAGAGLFFFLSYTYLITLKLSHVRKKKRKAQAHKDKLANKLLIPSAP